MLVLLFLFSSLVPLLLLMALYSFFKVKRTSPDASFFSNILLAHRGCMHQDLDIAENSLDSLQYALTHGVNGVELDVILSLDGELMVFHDTHTMERVCDHRLKSDGSGERLCLKSSRIAEMTRKQIQESFRYRKGTEEHFIPTLSQFLDVMFKENSVGEMKKKIVMIEVKEYGKRSKEIARKVVQVYEQYPFLFKQSVVASFNPIVLYMVRQMNPDIVTNLLVRKGMFASLNQYTKASGAKEEEKPTLKQQIQSWISNSKIQTIDYLLYRSMISWVPHFIGAGVIGIHNELANDLSFVQSLQKRGYVVNVWTVNSPTQKRALEQLGGIAITSDYLFDYTNSTYQLPESIKRALDIQ